MREPSSAVGSQKSEVTVVRSLARRGVPDRTYVHPMPILSPSYLRSISVLCLSCLLKQAETAGKQAKSSMFNTRRKKIGPKRRDTHHRYDAALLCGGLWWVSLDFDRHLRAALPEGTQRAGSSRDSNARFPAAEMVGLAVLGPPTNFPKAKGQDAQQTPTHQSYPTCQPEAPPQNQRKMISDNTLRSGPVHAPRGANALGGACEGRCFAGSRLIVQSQAGFTVEKVGSFGKFWEVFCNLAVYRPVQDSFHASRYIPNGKTNRASPR